MESAAVTESARKNLYGFLVLAFIFTCYIVYKNEVRPGPVRDITNTTNQNETVKTNLGRIGEGYFNFEIADTPNKLSKGLSGRTELPPTDAMLFVFSLPGRQCFWMKDMKFNIDILWFDANKKLVHQELNVDPNSYPKNFCPEVSAQYVVEVTAGVAQKNQIKIGDSLDIEL